MDGIHVGDFAALITLGDVQITLAAAGWPNANRLVCKADMERVAVRLGINRHRGYSQLLAGADDPQGDLPAMATRIFWNMVWIAGYFCRLGRIPNRGCPYSTG